MRPEVLAALTALLWAVGSYFGKRGMVQAGLAPQLGLLVRLWVSALALLAISAPKLAELLRALGKPVGQQGVGQIALFEGLIAGTLGMLTYYTALRSGELSRVVPIAFTTPLWGFLLGVLAGGEAFGWMKALGVGAILLGIVLLNL